MKNRTWIQKLTSRKLWVSIGSFVSMIIIAIGGTESEAAQVSALIMAGATVLGYIIGEGLTDAAHKRITAEDELIKIFKETKNNKEEN